MASFERLEPPSGDMPVFDGHEKTEDEAEEGSRLPLLIVIALLVLAAFAGVVWLAYTQGVERGRADAPRVVETQPGTGSTVASVDKMYQQPAAPDEATGNGEAASPTPTTTPTPAIKAPPTVATQTAVSSASRKLQPATGTVTPANKVALAAPPQPVSKPVSTVPASVPVPKPLPVEPAKPAALAAHAPAMLSQQTSENSASEAKPLAQAQAPAAVSAPTPASVAAAGSYFLQIGAYKSQQDADAAWSSFKARHPAVASYQSNVKEADLGEKGIWYRLRIGAFPDKDTASAVCAKLKAEGASCFPAK
jgi:cell division protein FtsN